MTQKKETIGQKIRRLREAKKLRQVDLAAAIGVSVYTVMRWEGDDANPDEGNAQALGRYFKVPREEFHSATTALSPVGKRLDRLEGTMERVLDRIARLEEQLGG